MDSRDKALDALDDAIRAHIGDRHGLDRLVTEWAVVAAHVPPENDGQTAYSLVAPPRVPWHSTAGLLMVGQEALAEDD